MTTICTNGVDILLARVVSDNTFIVVVILLGDIHAGILVGVSGDSLLVFVFKYLCLVDASDVIVSVGSSFVDLKHGSVFTHVESGCFWF